MDQMVGDASAVREALTRLLANTEFGATPRQRGLLQFVVEETLEGRANRIKAFTIATSLFGRDADFDPQKSSIVRVEALRLRRILESFYAGPGAVEPLQFRLNPGSYVPQFAQGPAPAVPAAMEPDADSAEPALPPPETIASISRTHRPNLRLFLMGATALSVIGLGLTGAWMLAAPAPSAAPIQMASADTGQDSLTNLILDPLEPPGNDKAAVDLARTLTSDIQETLSLFENPRIIETAGNQAFRGYRLTGRLHRVSDDNLSLSVRMTRRMPDRPNEVVWSGRFDNIQPADLRGGGRPAPAIAVAKSLSQTYGAIFADVRQQYRDNPAQTAGFGCVVLAYDTLDEPTPANFRTARACLKRALAVDDDFASGLAALAYLDIGEWQYGLNEEPENVVLDRARELTRQAVRIAPAKGRMHAARFWARFVSESFEDAFQSAKVAMELNPFASDTVARLGAARLLRGEVKEGRRLLEQSAAANETRPSWQDFFLFLGAYLDDDFVEAARYAQLGGVSKTPLGLLAQIIVATKAGDAEAAQRGKDQLRKAFPSFAGNVDGALDRWQMLPALRARLISAAAL